MYMYIILSTDRQEAAMLIFDVNNAVLKMDGLRQKIQALPEGKSWLWAGQAGGLIRNPMFSDWTTPCR